MSITDPAALRAMQERAEEASQLLKTLANAQRLRVLCLLVGKEMTVGQINDQLSDLSQSALSQHLAKLRDEGMVHLVPTGRRPGTECDCNVVRYLLCAEILRKELCET